MLPVEYLDTQSGQTGSAYKNLLFPTVEFSLLLTITFEYLDTQFGQTALAENSPLFPSVEFSLLLTITFEYLDTQSVQFPIFIISYT